jgi:cysteine desulfurase/selenocysteine lyase
MAEYAVKTKQLDVDFDALRLDFPIFHNNPTLHYLDSAATSQKPNCVIDAITQCYRNDYGPVHRGLYSLAENASEQYEAARQTLSSYINSAQAENIVFTRSATEAINLVATGWARQHIQAGDEIWVSQMEHHSNYLPWQRLCQEQGATLCIMPLDKEGQIDMTKVDGMFGDRTRLIAVTHVSNVLGVINPIQQIIALAAARSIPVLVDAAQSIGHMPIDVQTLDCDFLVASAHKMCGPTGIGLLYAKPERLAETEPLILGGGMVDEVQYDHSSWAEIPARFEAGSPNLAGALGFAAAASYLSAIGRSNIENRIRSLTQTAYETLTEIAGVTVYGSACSDNRSGILSFNIDGIHPHDISHIAGEQGVAIRAGHHCCQPLMQYLGISSTARASFSLYNNEQDIAALAQAIHQTIKILGR